MLKKKLHGLVEICRLVKKRATVSRLPKERAKYAAYDSQEFVQSLEAIGIFPGDSLFVMCSPDQILDKTGRSLPTHLLLNDLLQYLGDGGTLMVLGFSKFRREIIAGTRVFNLLRSPTNCGMLSELLRRKPDCVRSLQPMFSALAYGKKAQEYCSAHSNSCYPFGKESPYFKIIQDNGKFLGIGVGIEAYTPMYTLFDCHVGADVPLYGKTPKLFNVVAENGEERRLESLVKEGFYGVPAMQYHFKKLAIPFSDVELGSGLNLFSMNMLQWFDASKALYDEKGVSPYHFNLPKWQEHIFYLYRKIRRFISRKDGG